MTASAFTNPLTPTGAQPMTVTDTLDAMLALYATPGTWRREGIAVDTAGQPVPADSPEAVAWSLEGALERVIGEWEGDEHRTALLCGASEACGVYLSEFNDTVCRQDVIVAVLRGGRGVVAAERG